MLLARLKAAGSRALIFTQMTRMLDVLEAFLNLHGHSYCRLDGSTKPEQRQVCHPVRNVLLRRQISHSVKRHINSAFIWRRK